MLEVILGRERLLKDKQFTVVEAAELYDRLGMIYLPNGPFATMNWASTTNSVTSYMKIPAQIVFSFITGKENDTYDISPERIAGVYIFGDTLNHPIGYKLRANGSNKTKKTGILKLFEFNRDPPEEDTAAETPFSVNFVVILNTLDSFKSKLFCPHPYKIMKTKGGTGTQHDPLYGGAMIYVRSLGFLMEGVDSKSRDALVKGVSLFSDPEKMQEVYKQLELKNESNHKVEWYENKNIKTERIYYDCDITNKHLTH